jgi:ABC-2 type transport system ATP-binding protein
MSPDPISVRAESLTRTFGQFVAVDHIDLSVTQGEIFGFLGPNGAGKSTTIKMLCGILPPTSGRALIGGFDLAREPDRIRQIIGYMSQRFSLYEDLTVEENIDFFGGVQIPEAARLQQRRRWAIEMASLEPYRKTLSRDLSGGVRQRLALACATIHEPKILFLDEPTAGVDPTSRRDFWELIYQLSNRGVTVFVSTHYMDEAEHCDRLGLIHRGKLVASGSPREIKSSRMHQTLLEIEAADLVRLMELASSLESVTDVMLFGNRLHVVVRDPDRAKSEIAQGALATGLAIHSIEVVAPALEDVFLSLLED